MDLLISNKILCKILSTFFIGLLVMLGTVESTLLAVNCLNK
uniref:Uncharacterized protein n=1 Tax=Octopus bimaculoides TaxID=37653 RepID=A0A0L8HXT5_OCTBM